VEVASEKRRRGEEEKTSAFDACARGSMVLN